LKGLLLETLGLEYEGLSITQDKLVRLFQNNKTLKNSVRVTHDASSELMVRILNDRLKMVNHNDIARRLSGREYKSGYEAVTVPLSFDEMEKTVTQLLGLLKEEGEFFSPRASIHIHVGFAHNLGIMKTGLEVGLALDSLFFQLGAMGGKFRGSINESIYCRPLTNGQVARCENRKNYQLLSPEKALKTDNVNDFWAQYAVDPDEPPNRYISSRYFAWNLFSVLLHNTIEFRYFNQSLDINEIMAVISLCQGTAEMILNLSQKIDGSRIIEDKFQNLPIFKNHSKEEYGAQLLSLVRLMYDLGGKFVPKEYHLDTLASMLNISEPVVISRTPVKTHLQNYYIPERFASVLDSAGKNVGESGFVDIHNIKDFSILEI